MEALGSLASDKGRGHLNLEDNVRLLQRKLKRLSCRKSDLEFEVTNVELSGTKKRKREVENWFEEVEEIKDEFNSSERE